MSAFTTINLYQKDAEPLTFQKDEVIFEAGDKGDVMYALLEGEVGLWVKDQLVEVFSSGDVFGEGALVQPDHTRGSRAIAHTYCQLLTIDQNRFLFVCENTPMFAIEVMRSFSNRLRNVKEQFAKQV